MLSKGNKYFSISEAAELTGLPPSKLRYIEKFNPLIKTIKIRDRRYYTRQVVDYIIEMYNSAKRCTSDKAHEKIAIIQRIDIILNKLREFI